MGGQPTIHSFIPHYCNSKLKLKRYYSCLSPIITHYITIFNQPPSQFSSLTYLFGRAIPFFVDARFSDMNRNVIIWDNLPTTSSTTNWLPLHGNVIEHYCCLSSGHNKYNTRPRSAVFQCLSILPSPPLPCLVENYYHVPTRDVIVRTEYWIQDHGQKRGSKAKQLFQVESQSLPLAG